MSNSESLLIFSKYLKNTTSPTSLNPSNNKSNEAFSGGGAWDEEDDTIDSYKNEMTSLPNISESLISFENDNESILNIAFGYSTTFACETKNEISRVPDNFLPKVITGISEFFFQSKQFPKTNLNLDSSPSEKLNDVDGKTASAALKGFMPFAEDPDKQSRYIKYLRYCQDKSDKICAPKSLLYIDEREREEFIMSAQIFKPASSIISARFESSTAGMQPQVQLKPGLTRPEAAKKQASDFGLNFSQIHEIKPSRHSKMSSIAVGRALHVWSPNALLCKRFNVTPPDLGVAGTAEFKPIKPILAEETVEQLINIFMKDSKNNSQFETSEKRHYIQENFVPSLPSNDLFDEIFGSKDSTAKPNSNRTKAVDYFGED